jgi:hypothetical protein
MRLPLPAVSRAREPPGRNAKSLGAHFTSDSMTRTITKIKMKPGLVAHAYNPSYLGS